MCNEIDGNVSASYCGIILFFFCHILPYYLTQGKRHLCLIFMKVKNSGPNGNVNELNIGLLVWNACGFSFSGFFLHCLLVKKQESVLGCLETQNVIDFNVFKFRSPRPSTGQFSLSLPH